MRALNPGLLLYRRWNGSMRACLTLCRRSWRRGSGPHRPYHARDADDGVGSRNIIGERG